jgi:hypothetical protein
MSAGYNSSRLTRQTYRQLVYGFVGIGILGLLAGMVLEQYLVGTVVYLVGGWIGGAIAFLAPRYSDATLQDERDYDLHNRASGLTMLVAMGIGMGVVPALYVLDAGGYIDPSGAPTGAVLTASALFLLYGVCYGVAKRRQ